MRYNTFYIATVLAYEYKFIDKLYHEQFAKISMMAQCRVETYCVQEYVI